MKNMIRFYLFALIILCSSISINAQTAKDEIYDDIHRSAANYYAYPTPDAKLTPAPSGYKPFYISTYARHGSRYLINANDYEMPLNVMRQAKQKGLLTALGEKTLSVLDSVSRMAKGRYGELTPLGARQHQGIAKRMFQNYPEVFKGDAQIDSRSTVVVRCILSMAAENMQLKSMNPRLKFIVDASNHDMYYMNNSDPWVNQYRRDKGVMQTMMKYYQNSVSPKRILSSLFSEPDSVKFKGRPETFLRTLFDVASNMQSLDTDMELYSLFTKEECYDLWKISNIQWYINYGFSPITKGKMPYIEAKLLENIINTADTCVNKGVNCATLRFGHEVCVLPLACLLELDDLGIRTQNLDSLDAGWRDYKIFPMACNIQFVFFKKKSGGDVLVKVLLNEHEAKLPVNSNIAPYYKWNDVKVYYQQKLATWQK